MRDTGASTEPRPMLELVILYEVKEVASCGVVNSWLNIL